MTSKLLRNNPELPVTTKSLLKTNVGLCKLINKFNPSDLLDSSGFVYISIAINLQRIINSELHSNSILKLQFNIDGLTLFKLSPVEMWPILGKTFTSDNYYKLFVVAAYCGKEKPKSAQKLLDDFVLELNFFIKKMG